MPGRVPRHRYPWWVQVGLWGVPGRAGAWAFFAVAGLSAVALPAIGIATGIVAFYAGLLFLLAALWYWLCIRWVDEHGSWD